MEQLKVNFMESDMSSAFSEGILSQTTPLHSYLSHTHK